MIKIEKIEITKGRCDCVRFVLVSYDIFEEIILVREDSGWCSVAVDLTGF